MNQTELVPCSGIDEMQELPKGVNPFGCFSSCILKKCCKKHKKGKRCKKCPNR